MFVFKLCTDFLHKFYLNLISGLHRVQFMQVLLELDIFLTQGSVQTSFTGTPISGLHRVQFRQVLLEPPHLVYTGFSLGKFYWNPHIWFTQGSVQASFTLTPTSGLHRVQFRQALLKPNIWFTQGSLGQNKTGGCSSILRSF